MGLGFDCCLFRSRTTPPAYTSRNICTKDGWTTTQSHRHPHTHSANCGHKERSILWSCSWIDGVGPPNGPCLVVWGGARADLLANSGCFVSECKCVLWYFVVFLFCGCFVMFCGCFAVFCECFAVLFPQNTQNTRKTSKHTKTLEY